MQPSDENEDQEHDAQIEGEGHEVQLRGGQDKFHVSKKAIEAYGPTEGCPACNLIKRRGVSPGRVGVNHNDNCRERVVFAMKNDPQYRQLMQKHYGMLDVMQAKGESQVGGTTSDHKVRLEEQRGHVRKAIHMVKQKMGEMGRDTTSQLDQAMLQILITSMDVAEFYSPPRIANMAANIGLRAGWSMDIITNDTDGRAWDFNVAEMRNRAARRVLTDKPMLFIGSPMCTIHSVMNNMNYAHMPPEVVKKRFDYARRHLEFATQLYKLQMQGGRYFLHGHFESASSWQEKCIKSILQMEGVKRVVADQCRYGLKSKDENGVGPARKSTGFMTNSPCIALQLKRRCPNRQGYEIHRHVRLENGRARAAQQYPPNLCRAVCKGLIKQMEADRNGNYLLARMEFDETQSSKDLLKVAREMNEKYRTIEEEDFECVPCDSGGTIEPKRHPGDPTKSEVDEHNLTHCPFRSWCPICVEAQGKEDPHYRSTEEDLFNVAPVVSMDYKELSEYNEDKIGITTVVCRDKWTKAVASHVVKPKGFIECAKRLVEFLDSFGYREVSLKSDNESAIKVLRDEVIGQRSRPTRPAGSVPLHPQTHGRAEKAIQDVTDQVRKLKMALEQRLNARLSINIPVMHWMVEHAALLINRHQLGHDGKTAYRRVHQREAPASQFEFAEQVLARFAPKRSNNKRKVPLAPRSTPGIWVGFNEATAENIIVFQSGRAVRARTAFRRPVSERWSLENVLRVRATPTSPNLAHPDQEITILKPSDESNVKSGKDVPKAIAVPESTKRRNFKMTKRLFEDFGFTPGCVGCEAIDEGLSRRSHSKYCRERIAQELERTDEGRKVLKSASDRFQTQQKRSVDCNGSHIEGREPESPTPNEIVEAETSEDSDIESNENDAEWGASMDPQDSS